MSGGNWGILGNEWSVNLLKKHIQLDRVRNAYLFCGPAGVGRRTLALRFIQALDCTNPPKKGEACQVCTTCKQIERMQYPDLEVIQSISPGGTLQVKQVREAQRSLSFKPYQGKYRVALFLRFQEATDSASNALLKTLEEAPEHLILILTADSPDQLLPTIVSRCEILRLRAEPVEQVEALLKEKGAEDHTARLLGHLSEGRVGSALGLLAAKNRIQIMEERTQWLDELGMLLSSNRLERFNYAERISRPRGKKSEATNGETKEQGKPSEDENGSNKPKLAKNREEVRHLISLWSSYWRDVMLTASGAGVELVNIDRVEEISRLAEIINLDQASALIGKMEKGLQQLERNVNLRLLVEDLLLDWPYLKV